MQVETQRSSLLTPSSLSGSGVTQSVPVARRPAASTRAPQNAFPDQPLISSQPLRYNVQLNQQLTSVQQADRFLQETENHVLQLNHAITRRAGSTEIIGQAEKLQTLLTRRSAISGGTVNRRLEVNLEAKSQVKFTLRDGNSLINNPQPELLTFSLAGAKRDISSASLAADSTPQQSLLRLNQALGKWGIRGSLDVQRQVSFQVDEQSWSRVNQHLSVQGGGERYPANQFFPVKPVAENTLEDDIQRLLDAPAAAEKWLPGLDAALDTLTQQRRALQQSKTSVQQRIASMATFSGTDSAVEASQRVALQFTDKNFAQLTRALGAQANIHAATVTNVLSQS